MQLVYLKIFRAHGILQKRRKSLRFFWAFYQGFVKRNVFARRFRFFKYGRKYSVLKQFFSWYYNFRNNRAFFRFFRQMDRGKGKNIFFGKTVRRFEHMLSVYLIRLFYFYLFPVISVVIRAGFIRVAGNTKTDPYWVVQPGFVVENFDFPLWFFLRRLCSFSVFGFSYGGSYRGYQWLQLFSDFFSRRRCFGLFLFSPIMDFLSHFEGRVTSVTLRAS